MKYFLSLLFIISLTLTYGQNEKTLKQIDQIEKITQKIDENLCNYELKGFGGYDEETLRYDSTYYYFYDDELVLIKLLNYGQSGLGKSRSEKYFYYIDSICVKYMYYHQDMQFSKGYRDENMAFANEIITYVDTLGNCLRNANRSVTSTIGTFKEDLKNKKFYYSYGWDCGLPQDEKYLKKIDKAEVIRPQKKE